jgi:hypothetical protein
MKHIITLVLMVLLVATLKAEETTSPEEQLIIARAQLRIKSVVAWRQFEASDASFLDCLKAVKTGKLPLKNAEDAKFVDKEFKELQTHAKELNDYISKYLAAQSKELEDIKAEQGAAANP